MRLRLLAAALLAASTAASAADPAALEQSVRERVIEWRRDIHQHPELGNRETRTAALVAEHLRALGMQPRTDIAHTGVAAILKGGRPGPRIAIRADMDALPVTEATGLPFASTATDTYNGETVGVMHACGHDAHVAIAMGVAEALAGMRETLPGEVMFIFQPAEEGPPPGEEGGASLMLAEGLFADFVPEAVFGLHVWSALPVGHIGFRSGPMMASADRWTLEVSGTQTHGARPWGGVDPIAVLTDILQAGQQLVAREVDPTREPVVFSTGMVRAGIRYNIIPDRAEAVGTLRAFTPESRERFITRFSEIARHTAEGHRATASFASETSAPATANDPALAARMGQVLRQRFGSERVGDIDLMTVAEDFSEFANVVPGFYFFVGVTDGDPEAAPSNHSPEFMIDERALATGTEAMLAVALAALGAQSADE